MSKVKSEEDISSKEISEKEKTDSTEQFLIAKKDEEQILNLETYASARELTFQAKSRLQYLVDSNQVKREMTIVKWDETLKGC